MLCIFQSVTYCILPHRLSQIFFIFFICKDMGYYILNYLIHCKLCLCRVAEEVGTTTQWCSYIIRSPPCTCADTTLLCIHAALTLEMVQFGVVQGWGWQEDPFCSHAKRQQLSPERCWRDKWPPRLSLNYATASGSQLTTAVILDPINNASLLACSLVWNGYLYQLKKKNFAEAYWLWRHKIKVQEDVPYIPMIRRTSQYNFTFCFHS